MSIPSLTLYQYWRSSCSWRVRWALDYKGISYQKVAVNILLNEQFSPEHLVRSPKGFIPVLKVNNQYLTESLAILEWIEEQHPKPSLLPNDSFSRAQVRKLSLLITAGIQPLQNMRTLKFYSDDQSRRNEWAKHFIAEGMKNFEAELQNTAGTYCYSSQLSFADLCLIPQCYNALRFGVALEQFPIIHRIYHNCLRLESYQSSVPENQPDAVKS